MLVQKWRSHSPRFLTDLPFMYGLVFWVLGLGESVDVSIETGVLMGTVEDYKFRLVFVILTVSIMCFTLFQIWLPKQRRIKYGGIFSFGMSWLVLTVLSSTREAIYLLAAGYLMAMIVPYGITYYLVYRYHRLPEVDARLILLATAILTIGQGLKTWFLAYGILWISETIDMTAWVTIYFGVTRPSPSSQAMPQKIAAIQTVT
ncbi:MAG: hypothetical protein ACTSW4_01190 [Candidatus Ranarchaeia archaeon]